MEVVVAGYGCDHYTALNINAADKRVGLKLLQCNTVQDSQPLNKLLQNRQTFGARDCLHLINIYTSVSTSTAAPIAMRRYDSMVTVCCILKNLSFQEKRQQ